MRAILVVDRDGNRQLALGDIAAPVPGPHDLLVDVHTAGFNRADLELSPSHYTVATDAPVAGGAEMSGIVSVVGNRCEGFAPGDRVMALCKGSFAERVLVHHRVAVHVPETVDLATAAALPSWYMTAHNAIVSEGAMQSGDIVLIQGATAGVGIAAAQIARMLGAAKIIGVGRDAEKLGRLNENIYDATVLAEADWPARVLAQTDGRGVDLVIDLVGGGVLDGNLRCARVNGTLVAVGRLGGAHDTLDLDLVARQRLKLIGVSFRSRSIEEKAAVARAFARDVLPAISVGTITPIIGARFPLAAAADAQAHVRGNRDLGKTLLSIADLN